MNYAIIGCGLIGKKRLAGLPAGSKLAVACDTNLTRAEELVKLAQTGRAVANYREAIADPQVNAVIVATVNAALAEVSAAAIRAGKPVLVEKPVGISVKQIDDLFALAKEHGVCVRAGFNHRYHPAFLKAREIFESGVMGELMFVRARYGHGGRIGYDKEWRAQPEISGGGELIDQGMHLIDLARWFLGDFTSVQGSIATYFWDMPVEDNGFLLLHTAQGQTAFLHASCTEWKNLFSFEIYGRTGKLEISGLGGSYGTERLALYEMRPEMGPPPTTIWEYPMADDSWQAEFQEFLEDIRLGRPPDPGIEAAQAALRIVEAVYKEAENR
ncbi:MAG TPA: Gfo/Idh/MocA family oxidoreductase [Verrucomicrobiae bacterium]|nr:Gfo/Idh/MocA family oxidoreductase [Verrucomicrobiae bacterium]